MINYQDYAILNKEGNEIYGNIFKNGKVPIVSIIQIKFDHPRLDDPETAYLIRGSDLEDWQIEYIIEMRKSKFTDIDVEEMKTELLNNNVPQGR